jgi:uroporphyrinogen decarboxylase
MDRTRGYRRVGRNYHDHNDLILEENKMNSYERVMTAVRGGIPDRVPIIELDIDPAVMDKIMPGADWLEFYEHFNVDGISIFYDLLYEDVAPDVKRDCFGILRNFKEMQGEFPVPIEPLIKADMDPMKFLDSYQMPEPRPAMLHFLKDAVERFKGEKALVFNVHTSLIYPTFMRGFDNFLMDYYVNPEFAKRLAEMFTDFFTELEKIAIEMGADIILEGEDYAGTTSLWMSVDLLEEFVLPGLQKAIKVAKDAGLPFVKHCDGDINSILDLLVEQGIDCLNPIEPAASMDLGMVKQKFGKKVALWGNVDCAQLLTFGTPDQVRDATIDCLKKAAPGGGYILSSSNTIHSAVPSDNFLAMVETTREYGSYPLKF